MDEKSARLLIVGISSLLALLVVAIKGRAIMGELRTFAARGRARKGVLPWVVLLLACVTVALVAAIPAVNARVSADTGTRCVTPTRVCTISAGEVGAACVCYDAFTGRGEIGSVQR